MAQTKCEMPQYASWKINGRKLYTGKYLSGDSWGNTDEGGIFADFYFRRLSWNICWNLLFSTNEIACAAARGKPGTSRAAKCAQCVRGIRKLRAVFKHHKSGARRSVRARSKRVHPVMRAWLPAQVRSWCGRYPCVGAWVKRGNNPLHHSIMEWNTLP